MARNKTTKRAPRKTALKRRTVKDQSGAGKLKIGELLQKAGFITASQFKEAQAPPTPVPALSSR